MVRKIMIALAAVLTVPGVLWLESRSWTAAATSEEHALELNSAVQPDALQTVNENGGLCI